MKLELFKKDSFWAMVLGLLLACSSGTPVFAIQADVYSRATLMFNNQEYELALEDYQEIVQGQGGDEIDAKAHFYLGECHFQLKDLAKARDRFRDYLVKFSAHEFRAKGQYRFAESLYLLKDYATAAKAYLRFVDDNAGDVLIPHALYAAAGALMELGESQRAEELLARLTKDHPDHAQVKDATYYMAWARFREKDYVKAAELFEAFADRYPRSEKALEALLRAADSFYSHGDHRRSLNFYNRVLADGRGQFKKDCHVGIAWSYYKLKEFEKAGNNFLILARSEEKSAGKAEYYYQCLRSYYDGSRFDTGYQLAQEMMAQADPSSLSGDVYYWQGLFSLKLGREKDAISFLSKAVEAKASKVSKPTILLELGNLYQKTSMLDEAVSTYRRALVEVGGDNEMESQIRYEASRTLHQMGRNQEAKEMVKGNLSGGRGGESSSLTSLSEFSMGEFKYSEGDHRGALLHYEKAMASSEKTVAEDALYRSSWCYRYLDQKEKAIAFFTNLESKSEKYRQEARYLLAELYREMGDLTEAGRWYEKVGLVKGQYGAHALLAKAQMQFEKGDSALSIKTLKALFREFPGTDVEWEGRLLLAELAYEASNFKEALSSYDLVISKGSKFLQESAVYGRAWLHFEQKSYDLALADLDRLLKEYPDSSFKTSSLQLKGQIFMQTDRVEQARDIFAMGLAGGKEGGESLLLNLASVETELKNHGKALEIYNQVLSRFPSPEVQGRVMYEKGWLYMEMSRPNEALLMFKAYRKSYPNGELIDDVNFALGQLAYDREAFRDAILAYGNCATSPRYMDKSLYKLGFSHFKLEQYREAGEAFSRLQTQAPQSPLALEALYREGQSWMKASDYARAEQALNVYISRGRNDNFYGEALFDLGLVLERQGKSSEAVDQYERYLKIFSEGAQLAEVQVYLGRLYMASGTHAKARDVLKLALKDRTHFLALEAQYMEGDAFYLEERYDEAIRSFLQTQLYKDGSLWQSKGLLMIGQSHRALKRFDRAKHYFEKLLDRYPQSDAAKSAIEALRTLDKS